MLSSNSLAPACLSKLQTIDGRELVVGALRTMTQAYDGLLQSVLENRQAPHQPLLVVQDTAFFSGLPFLRDLVLRSLAGSSPTVLVTFLRPPSTFLPSVTRENPLLRTVDLTTATPGFSQSPHCSTPEDGPSTVVQDILDIAKAAGNAVNVFMEGLEVFVEDWDAESSSTGTKAGLKLTRELLGAVKRSGAPSRLTLLLPYDHNTPSPFIDSMLSPELTPTVTHIHLHPKNLLLTHFPAQYLLPPTASPGTDLTIATLLKSARERGLGEQLALQGKDELEVLEDWGGSGGDGAVAEILVRKAQGGASKGILRSIDLLEPVSTDDHQPMSVLVAKPLPPLHSQNAPPMSQGQQDKNPHLDLPFNLSLTDAQRQARADVPVPYAHEGDDDGASKVAGAGIWWEADEGDGLDDEEEEI